MTKRMRSAVVIKYKSIPYLFEKSQPLKNAALECIHVYITIRVFNWTTIIQNSSVHEHVSLI